MIGMSTVVAQVQAGAVPAVARVRAGEALVALVRVRTQHLGLPVPLWTVR